MYINRKHPQNTFIKHIRNVMRDEPKIKQKYTWIRWVWDLFGNWKKWVLPSIIVGVGVASDEESRFEEVKSKLYNSVQFQIYKTNHFFCTDYGSHIIYCAYEARQSDVLYKPIIPTTVSVALAESWSRVVFLMQV